MSPPFTRRDRSPRPERGCRRPQPTVLTTADLTTLLPRHGAGAPRSSHRTITTRGGSSSSKSSAAEGGGAQSAAAGEVVALQDDWARSRRRGSSLARASCSSASARSNISHPITRASPSSNDSNPRSRLLYQAVARISVLVRRLWASLVFDGLAGGNHRRERAGATLGGGAWRVQMRDQRRRRVGPGHTGNVGAAHTSRPFASERFSPRAPAPAAPPLPAQYAIRRDRSDESALSPRRSTLPPKPAPRRSACDSADRRRAGSR